MANVYTEHGYKNREDYLDSLAEEYSAPKTLVYSLAELLGPNEAFVGLVRTLEEDV